MPVEPLPYAPPPLKPPGSQHNTIYTACLVALAVFCAMAIISMTFMSRRPEVEPAARGTFQMIACIYGVLVAAMVVTLILRGVAPRAGRVATMGLNIVLLVLFPLGTALGIYGLLKVDKEPRADR